MPNVNPATMVVAAPLRRAMYTTIERMTQPFAIDPEKLKEEMEKVDSKVKTKGELFSSSKDQEDQTSLKESETDGSEKGGSEETSLDSKLPHKQPAKLIPPSGGFNLCLLVGKVNIVVDKLRVDRSRVRLAEVDVGDETGTVSLRARDDQIDLLQEISEKSGAVVLRNCTMELYQGKHLRLAITKWGKLSAYPDNVASTPNPPLKMNMQLNYSAVDLNLVVGDMPDSIEGTPPSPSSESQRHKPPIVAGSDISFDETLGSQRSIAGQQQYRRGSHKKQHVPHHRHAPSAGRSLRVTPYHGHGVVTPMNHLGMPEMASYGPLYSDGRILDSAAYVYPLSPHQREEGEGQHFQQMYQVPRDHHEKQHQLFLQQYEIQQRHLEQMQLFQQEQERQRHFYEPHGQQHLHQIHQNPSSLPYVEGLHIGSIDNGNNPVNSNTDTSIAGSQHDGVQTSSKATLQHRLHQQRQEPTPQPKPGMHSQVMPYDSGVRYQTVGVDDGKPTGGKDDVGQGESAAGGGRNRGEQSMPRQTSSRSAFVGPAGDDQFHSQLPPNRIWSWGYKNPNVLTSTSETSPPSPGRMNPQATSFAPSYAKPPGMVHHLQSTYPYSHYDPTQAAAAASMYGSPLITHQHPMYSQGALFVPVGNMSTMPGYQTHQNTMELNAQFPHHAHVSTETESQEDPREVSQGKQGSDAKGGRPKKK